MATVAEGEAQAGGSKKLLIIILAVVVLGGGGAAAFFMLKPQAPAGQAAQEETKKSDELPVYEKLDSFVVNLTGQAGTVLQTDLQVQLAKEADREVIKAYMPQIRSNLILLLSSKTPPEMETPEGKEKLKKQIKQVINDSIESEHKPVKAVLFTSFIIQTQ